MHGCGGQDERDWREMVTRARGYYLSLWRRLSLECRLTRLNDASAGGCHERADVFQWRAGEP